MKRITLISLLLCLFILLCSCMTANPIEKMETTAAPGLSMELYPASASSTNADVMTATLYFRYLDEPMLASETRVFNVDRDKSFDLMLIQELLTGPTAGHVELGKLFSDSVRVISATAKSGILYVTFNDALISNDDLPTNRETDWVNDASMTRRLALQSVVASVTENTPYTGVQFFVSQSEDSTASTRLGNDYFLTGQGGVSDPITRDESLLLTPHNTADLILLAWHERDYQTLYTYTATQMQGESRPTYDVFVKTIDACAALSTYSLSSGSVSQHGNRAVLSIHMTTMRDDIATTTQAYPLQLRLENGIWKISYSALLELISR